MAERNSPEGQAKLAEQRSFENQTTDRKRAEASIAAVVDPVDLNRVLLEKVRGHAQNLGLSALPGLPNQGPRSPDDQPKYQAAQDYVLEITVTERTVLATGTNADPSFAVGFSARGLLVRTADSKVMRVFTTHEATGLKSGKEWNAGDSAQTIAELNSVLEKIAETAVDRWMRTAIASADDQGVTVVVIRPRGRSGSFALPALISIDGCIAGYVADGTFLRIRTTAGKHTFRPERLSAASSYIKFMPYTVELKPGETYYLEIRINNHPVNSWELIPAYHLIGEEFMRKNKEHGQQAPVSAFPGR